MLATLSPAKSLDLSKHKLTKKHSTPIFLKESRILIDRLRNLTPSKLSKLMAISLKLAEQNHERFAAWQLPFTPANAKQAVLTFKGDVYLGLNAEQFSPQDFKFAQVHLRILSGLYGLLRPLDLIQPYRLEMGTKLDLPRGKNLYEFWGARITEALKDALKAQDDNVLINLASNEYFKSVQPKLLDARIITPVFKDASNGTYKVLSFFAKQARGSMVSYIVRNRLVDPDDIKSFDVGGYRHNARMSKGDTWVFTRKKR